MCAREQAKCISRQTSAIVPAKMRKLRSSCFPARPDGPQRWENHGSLKFPQKGEVTGKDADAVFQARNAVPFEEMITRAGAERTSLRGSEGRSFQLRRYSSAGRHLFHFPDPAWFQTPLELSSFRRFFGVPHANWAQRKAPAEGNAPICGSAGYLRFRIIEVIGDF